MAPKQSEKKTTFLSIAISPQERAILDKVAVITGIPKSVYSRSVLMANAKEVVAGAKGK